MALQRESCALKAVKPAGPMGKMSLRKALKDSEEAINSKSCESCKEDGPCTYISCLYMHIYNIRIM